MVLVRKGVLVQAPLIWEEVFQYQDKGGKGLFLLCHLFLAGLLVLMGSFVALSRISCRNPRCQPLSPSLPLGS